MCQSVAEQNSDLHLKTFVHGEGKHLNKSENFQEGSEKYKTRLL